MDENVAFTAGQVILETRPDPAKAVHAITTATGLGELVEAIQPV